MALTFSSAEENVTTLSVVSPIITGVNFPKASFIDSPSLSNVFWSNIPVGLIFESF